MEQYLKFLQIERKDKVSLEAQFNNIQKSKNHQISKRNKLNLIGNIGSNIVNSVKHNKNYLFPDIGNEDHRYTQDRNNYFNTPQRNSDKFSLENIPNDSSYINPSKNKKKLFNAINHNYVKNVNYLSPNVRSNFYYPVEAVLNNDNYVSFGHIPTHSYLLLDEDSIYSYLNFVSLLLEIESNIDNKLYVSNYASKYLDTFESFFILNNKTFDIFMNETLNKNFQKIFKFSLILTFLIKTIILQFNYDYNIKISLKKFMNCFNEILCIFFDIFVFSDSTKSLKQNKKELIEKVQRISRSNCTFFNRKNKINEVTLHLTKLFDNLSNILKYYSLNYFKLVIPPFHNVMTDLLNSNEKIKVLCFCNIIIKYLLYGMIRKEESLNSLRKNIRQRINEISPYLPKRDETFKYTLVLDLDETLINQTPCGGTFFVRPYALEFLSDLCKIFEIIIFTAATQEYADGILDLIDPDYNLIKYRLYRHHTSLYENNYTIKYYYFLKRDLSLLGRDLNRTILIDNISDNYAKQPLNGLSSITWKDNIFDSQLLDFKDILLYIHQNNVEDVTELIKFIKNELKKYQDSEEENNYPKIDLSKFK